MQMNIIFYCFLSSIVIHTDIIDATHFEGGTITYKVLNTSGSTVSIVLTQTYIYDYTKITCTNSMIANQSPKLTFNPPYQEDTETVNCIQYCNQSGGYIAPGVVSYCTDYSVGLGITVGQRSDTINITNGSYFLVAYQSSSWRQLSLPAGSSSSNTAWSISCLINLQLRSDGSYNQPPVATIISPIYIPVKIQQNIFIPTIDSNNDVVRCRFANGTNECGDACPPASLPNGTILYSNCTLIVTGAKYGDWYAITIEIEDFIDTNSTTPLSSVPLQFLINVRNVSSCSKRPLLTGPVSQTGDCVGIQVGQPYFIRLIAENFCPNSTTIIDIATLSFPIVIKTPIVQNTTTLWSITLTWTPTAAAIGSQILCAVAIDSTNVQSNQYCMAFTVAQESIPQCPGQVAATTQVATSTTSMTSQVTSTRQTTITSLLSTFATSSSSIQSTSHGTESTIRSSFVSTSVSSTSVSSVSQSNSSLPSWLSTKSPIFTSQSSFQYTTYTSLISTSQSTTNHTTVSSTLIAGSWQSSSMPTSWLNTKNTTPTVQSSFQSITYTSSTSMTQSTSSSTTVSRISASSSWQSSSMLSSWLSTINATVASQSSFQYTTDTLLPSTIQSITSFTTTSNTSVSSSSQNRSFLSSLPSTVDATPTDKSDFQYTTNLTLISTIESMTSSIALSSTLVSSLSENNSSLLSITDKNPTVESDFQYTTDIASISIMQPTNSMTSITPSLSEDSTMTITVNSTQIVQQSLNVHQNNVTTKLTATSTSSESTSSFPWISILLAVLALILLTVCLCCCCYCCPRLCACCPFKRGRKSSSSEEVPVVNGLIPSPIPPYIVYNENSPYFDDDIFAATRPSSVASSRNADDIQLIGLTSARKNKPIPHHATPLQRSPRIAPMPTRPTEYSFGNRPPSKINP